MIGLTLSIDGDFYHQGRDTEISQKFKTVETYTDITIHWKALEVHFLMVPLVFRFQFSGKFFFNKVLMSPKITFSDWRAYGKC
jgi:hypothetical protein